jgi:PAS domain S-box-containing protein
MVISRRLSAHNLPILVSASLKKSAEPFPPRFEGKGTFIMRNTIAIPPKEIMISLEGMPGPALGCIMVDRSMKMLWNRAFTTNWPNFRPEIAYCYEIFGRKFPCPSCAASRAFSTGRPASCEKEFVYEDGKKIFFQIVASPIKGENGNINHCIEILQDITSRKKIEEKYKKVSDFNYSIIYNAPVGIFTLNKKGIIISTNPAHVKIAGNPAVDKLMGFDWLHCSAVRQSGLDVYLEKGLAGESFEVIDFPFRADITGKELSMNLKGVPLKNKQNEIEGLLCIIDETTEKARYISEIEHLKKHNENIVQSIKNGIMVVDRDLQVLTWNQGMEKIFNLSPSQVLNLSLEECLLKMNLIMTERDVRELLETGKSRYVKKVSIFQKQRGTISISYSIMPLYDEDRYQSGVILFFEDITKKEEYEIKYQSLFNGAIDAIVVTELGGAFISANLKTLELLETDWKDLAGKNIFHIICDEDVKILKECLDKLCETIIDQPYKIRLKNKVGASIPVETTVSIVRMGDHAVALQFIMRDIRQRIKLEAQLQQANKLSGLGELAAGVAHEINNPLATIAGCSEEVLDLLSECEGQKVLETEDRNELNDLVRVIKEQSYRCKEITRSLLDFARVNEPTLVDVNINEMILHVLSISGYERDGDGKRLELVFDSALPNIKTDYFQIQQVFLNVLKNALDATEEGGQVTVRTQGGRNFVSIIVADTGVGMTPEEQSRIFDPFFTTKAPDRGTGLGLSICFRIIEQLGGQIEMKSRKNFGTTFRTTFPHNPKY